MTQTSLNGSACSAAGSVGSGLPEALEATVLECGSSCSEAFASLITGSRRGSGAADSTFTESSTGLVNSLDGWGCCLGSSAIRGSARIWRSSGDCWRAATFAGIAGVAISGAGCSSSCSRMAGSGSIEYHSASTPTFVSVGGEVGMVVIQPPARPIPPIASKAAARAARRADRKLRRFVPGNREKSMRAPYCDSADPRNRKLRKQAFVTFVHRTAGYGRANRITRRSGWQSGSRAPISERHRSVQRIA